jgi:flavin reductase (DIM6/NTAB) family NADH-FMN oxidoreductase RutF
MASDELSDLLTSMDPPMVLVTTAAEGEWAGCLVGFHGRSSIDPGHYSVWLSKANHTYRVALRAKHFAVHALTTDDTALAERFGTRTGEDEDKFAGLDTVVDEYGVPLLTACQHRMTLDKIAVLDAGGDHVCIVAGVRSARTPSPFTPLRLSAVEHLTPGHEADERAIDPQE